MIVSSAIKSRDCKTCEGPSIHTYRKLAVSLMGEACTSDNSERVPMSALVELIARKSSKMPPGGSGPS